MEMDPVPEIVFQGEGFHIESVDRSQDYELSVQFVHEPTYEAYRRLHSRSTTLFAPRPRDHVYDDLVGILKAIATLLVKEQEIIDARNRRRAIDTWTRFLACAPSMRVTWKSRLYHYSVPREINPRRKEYLEVQAIVEGFRNPRILHGPRITVEVDTVEFGVLEVDIYDKGDNIESTSRMNDDVHIEMDPLPPPDKYSLAFLAKRQLAENIVDGRFADLSLVLKEALGLYYLPSKKREREEEDARDEDEPDEKKARF